MLKMLLIPVHVISFRKSNPNLWTEALGYFSEKEDDCRSQITEVLTRILYLDKAILFSLFKSKLQKLMSIVYVICVF